MTLKNITLSASESMIKEARRRASEEKTTVNALFRAWLANYLNRGGAGDRYRSLMGKLVYANAGRKFSRDECNER